MENSVERLNLNKWVALEMLKGLPENKLEVLKKALERNFSLTSAYTLSGGELTVYKEGWYLELSGTRSSFSVYAKDNDGIIEVQERKPIESKLHKLFKKSVYMFESDYDFVWC